VDRLDGLLSRPGIGVTGLREVGRSVEELMVAMARSTDQGSGVPAGEVKSQLAYQLTRRQLAVGEFERAQALRDEKEAQRRQAAAVSRPIQTVAADRPGFFVNEVDGYEGIFRSALAGKLNAAQLRELAEAEPAPTEGAVCKLVEDFTWYFVCQADDRQAAALEQGRTYRLRFAYAPQTDMPALLEHVYASGEEGYVLTFAGTRMTPEMMLLRRQAVSILQTTYEGLRISNEARRVVDGVVGVYVRSGLTMEFRPVEVIYATDTYSIVKWEQGKSGALRLYDEVIITGKDIYEGRIVK